MKIHATDLEDMTHETRVTVLAILNEPSVTPTNYRKTLDRVVAAQRRWKRKRLKELQTTAHVVKRGDWGLVEVVAVRRVGSGPQVDARVLRARWTRGHGKRWPLKDAERYAKLFGGTVRRSP